MDVDEFKSINDGYGHHLGDCALRQVAMALQAGLRPYDLCVRYAGDEFVVVLSECTRESVETRRKELQDRVSRAGIIVDECRLTHLAYAPEIAQAMLRRQQAEAVIAARQKIVIGAVSMVENAIQLLSEKDVVQLDDERKAAMVSNLMVVLCSERDTQPIVNTGSLYQ